MPMAGLGLPKCEPDAARGDDCREKARNATLEFLLLGGRLLDTALAYDNHRAVGAAIQEAVDKHGVRREDIFVSSKINPDWFGTGNVTRAVRRTLDELGLEYVDLLLLHHPGRAGRTPAQARIAGCDSWRQCRQDAWHALSRARDDRLVRAVGVSNFGPRQISELLELGAARVSSHQQELHPWVPKVWRQAADFCRDHGIEVTAYAAIGGGRSKQYKSGKFLASSTVDAIAKSHGRSPSQVLLRYAVQSGVHVIPRSFNPEHMRQNLDIFGWALSDEEMREIGSVPEGQRKPQYDYMHTPDRIP